MVLWRKKLLTQCEVRGKEHNLTLLLFSSVSRKNLVSRGTDTQLPLSDSLGNPFDALSRMSHSAFGKIVDLDDMQKFSVVTDFLKFLFDRNCKDLGSSGSSSCK